IRLSNVTCRASFCGTIRASLYDESACPSYWIPVRCLIRSNQLSRDVIASPRCARRRAEGHCAHDSLADARSYRLLGPGDRAGVAEVVCAHRVVGLGAGALDRRQQRTELRQQFTGAAVLQVVAGPAEDARRCGELTRT